MVHYLAERITAAEQLTGVEKAVAEKECFELINEIWRHRWSLPGDEPFLSKFKPLVETLKKLDPDRKGHFYSFPRIVFSFSELESKDNNAGVKDKFEAALKVDRLAKTLIHELLQQGVSDIEMPPDRWELIQNAIKLFETPDAPLIQFSTNQKYLEAPSTLDAREEAAEKIKICITALETFDSIKDELIEDYQLQLKELNVKE